MKALELGKGAGGETQKDWLKVSRYYICNGPERRATASEVLVAP